MAQEPDDRDLDDAMTLFCGIDHGSPTNSELKFPSKTTKPTEEEARAALVRELMDPEPPIEILMALAASIDFDEFQKCKTLLQRWGVARKRGAPASKAARFALAPDPEFQHPYLDPDRLRSWSYRRLVFKNLTQGHNNPRRIFQIAMMMQHLRRRHGYTKALEETGKRFFPKTEKESAIRQIKRILKNVKGRPWFDLSRFDGR